MSQNPDHFSSDIYRYANKKECMHGIYRDGVLCIRPITFYSYIVGVFSTLQS